MTTLGIPHDSADFVDEKVAILRTERAFAEENPPTHEQGTDRSSRAFKSAETSRCSSIETTDRLELEERRFARCVAAAMEELIRAYNVRTLRVPVLPHTLAE
jgi:hypothetical protein